MFALLTALLAAFALFLWLGYREVFINDFSRRSPRFSYRYFFDQAMPEDVTGFRAFGRSTLDGGEAGAIFNASPSTIRSLTSTMTRLRAADVVPHWEASFAAPLRFEDYPVGVLPQVTDKWSAWWSTSGSNNGYLFWNPQRREAWYYFWSE